MTNRDACILVAIQAVLIRNLVSAVLTMQGHYVLAAATASEALELARTCAGPLRLLVSQDASAGFDGESLARSIQQDHMKLPVLLLTSADCAELTALIRNRGTAIEFASLPSAVQQKMRSALSGP